MKNKQKQNFYKINHQIKAKQVRIVGSPIKEGIYDIREAIRKANELNLDLVEINSKQEVVVCKIMDYKKFLYDKNKNKKKQTKVETKEIRFRPTTNEEDYLFKKRNIEKFLQKGKRVKTYVMFKGREMKFKDQGEKLLLRLALELEGVGVAENTPKMEGYRMNLFFKPIKKNN